MADSASHERLEIAVLPPLQSKSAELLVAAGRSGGLPIIDGLRLVAVEELQRQTALLTKNDLARFGVRLDPRSIRLVQPSFEKLERPVDLAVLSKRYHSDKWDDLSDLVATLRRYARRVFCEVVCKAEADEATQARVDGLIAKGNEAAGRVGSESTFVLLQRLCRSSGLAIWAYGGIGPQSAAACAVAGASGIVLDNQLALVREATLPEALRRLIVTMDGSETICLGEPLQARYRVLARHGDRVVRRLRQLEGESAVEFSACLQEAIQSAGDDAVLPLGQDAAFAARLAERYHSVSGVLRAYRQTVADNLRLAADAGALTENAPLARTHGTRYPIAQGPMTRVSDVASFAKAVSASGALPFLALAMLRKSECEKLLQETAALLGDRTWGVGLLAFASPELRKEQLEAVFAERPRFAILAGGRPDQAQVLEQAGVATYLHVPSPRLLEMFLRQGARRFVFEGRECGGHIGPLSSFVLWEAMVEVLLGSRPSRNDDDPIDVLFAGGIHDELSAAMMAALAAPLSAVGVRIGVVMGTAYLFTEEAVATGAIAPAFQEDALRCRDSIVLDSGDGHAIRCAPTQYCVEFHLLKRQLLASGAAPEEVRRRLEDVHVGRLRIAAKGVARQPIPDDPAGRTEMTRVSPERQRRDGMYMLGEVAALRSEPVSMEQLHREVAAGSANRLRELVADRQKRATAVAHGASPEPIAIVGMACFLPGAADLSAYWSNILRGSNAVTEVPAGRWRSELFYDPARKAQDRVVSKWGGFLDPVPFDPASYGIPPASVDSIEPIHLLTLEAARRALVDAGYDRRPFPRERTAVIVAAGGGFCDRGIAYQTRCMVEHYLSEARGLGLEARDQVLRAIREIIPPATEDSLPGILGNVAAGRVANRLNLGGPNYSVDAACGSSLAALEAAVKELRHGSSDVALVGSTEGAQNVLQFLLFSKSRALSPTGRCRPFDAAADGIALSEGVAMVILKRLADARRDGDRVYAVLRGIAGASDGREMSLTAPAVNGQRRALERVYGTLDFSASTVSLVEAHGTGTVVGDRTELQTLCEVFRGDGAAPQSCALGSVKSQIGHTKNTAGLAGLIKVAKALHHATLPPTLFDRPNDAVRDRSLPFYISRRPRPWFGSGSSPRRAAISAFGFGGTNFHAILEEYSHDAEALADRPAELFVFRAETKAALVERVRAVREVVDSGRKFRLINLAAALQAEASAARGACRLAIVAGSALDRLPLLLDRAVAALERDESFKESEPIFFGEGRHAGKLGFLFPGQGSQELNMLEDLALAIPRVRRAFEAADDALDSILPKRLTQVIFPPPAYSPEEEEEQRRELDQTWLAQPALGAASYALFSLLTDLGVRADAMAGHSYGEYVALCASGALGFPELLRLSERRGRVVQETQGRDSIAMFAVQAPLAEVQPLVDACPGVSVAGENAPGQTLVGGASESLDVLRARLEERGIRYRRIAMSAGFHIPQAQPAADRFEKDLRAADIRPPQVSVYSNREAAIYPAEPDEIRRILIEQLTHPLRFKEVVEAMYGTGVRTFVEVGPGNVLSGLTRQILQDCQALIVSLGRPNSDGSLVGVLHGLGRLYAAGLLVHLDKLFGESERHSLRVEDLRKAPEPLPATTWMVDGGSAEPLTGHSLWRNQRVTEPAELKITAGKAALQGGARQVHQLPPNGPGLSLHSSEVKTVPNPSQLPDIHGSRPLAEEHVDLPVSAGLIESFQQTMRKFLDYQAETQRQRQELMAQFLATQRAMLAALTGNGAPPAIPAEPTPPAATSQPIEAPYDLASDRLREGSRTAETRSELWASPPPGATVKTEDAVPAHLTTRDLRKTLLDLVGRRTGYPIEMLDLDQNLEADLGIDSIKRTEIFGGLLERVGLSRDAYEREEYFLALARFRTLREVLKWLRQREDAANGHDTFEARASEAAPGLADRENPIGRYVVETMPTALDRRDERPLENRVILLTADELGVCDALAGALRSKGNPTIVVRQGADFHVLQPDRFEIDLRSRDAVAKLRDEIAREHGRVDSVFHLLPLSAKPSDTQDNLPLKSLFLLAVTFGLDLREGKGALLAATPLGGRLGLDGTPRGFSASAAAIPGLVKSMAQEWSEVRLKVVDCDAGQPPEELAASLLAEAESADDSVEVGYGSGGRATPVLVPADVGTGRAPVCRLDESSAVLITGGARGIAAKIAIELARTHRPRLILTGRSPLPGPEGADTASLTSPSELKRALAALRRRRGEVLTPAVVNMDYQALLNARQTRQTMAILSAMGVEFEYRPLDVRDERSLEALLAELYERHGRIDGVLHAAGVVEDSLLLAKSPESFDRVFDTKVRPALTLARALRPDTLQFLVFFSSIAARFGCAGSSDYAAANEALNRLACKLNREWPARVVALNWGPWAEVGMATHYSEAFHRERGFSSLPVAAACRGFLDELAYGTKSEPEVVLFASAGSEVPALSREGRL